MRPPPGEAREVAGFYVDSKWYNRPMECQAPLDRADGFTPILRGLHEFARSPHNPKHLCLDAYRLIPSILERRKIIPVHSGGAP